MTRTPVIIKQYSLQQYDLWHTSIGRIATERNASENGADRSADVSSVYCLWYSTYMWPSTSRINKSHSDQLIKNLILLCAFLLSNSSFCPSRFQFCFCLCCISTLFSFPPWSSSNAFVLFLSLMRSYIYLMAPCCGCRRLEGTYTLLKEDLKTAQYARES